MTKKYVSVTFIRKETVTAQVETDLSGADLEAKVEVSHEWMQQFFDNGWEYWEIDDVREITEDLSLVRDRHTNPGFDQMLREAPLFEVANDEEVEQ